MRKAAVSLSEDGASIAQDQLEQAIRLDSECGDAHHDLGVTLINCNRLAEAPGADVFTMRMPSFQRFKPLRIRKARHENSL